MTTPPDQPVLPAPIVVGDVPDKAVLMRLASACAQQFAVGSINAQKLATYVQAIGANGLGTAGFGTADGQAYGAAVAKLLLLSKVFLGVADGTVAEPENFAHELAQLIGPDPSA